jgi:hypothetical protein
MNMVYNSQNFCVVQFSDFGDSNIHPVGGFEIMDKAQRRGIFLDGEQARQFKDDVSRLIAFEPTLDEFDDFLENYTALMHQTVALH